MIRLPHEQPVAQFLDRLQQDDSMSYVVLFGGDRWRHVTTCACATVRGTMVGLATLAPCNELGGGGPHIIGVYIMPDHRKQGWGRALITALVEESMTEYKTQPTACVITPDGMALCRGIDNLIVVDQVGGMATMGMLFANR
jgi:ribosomal protein S18 acetylase RimI-like enzyme